MQILGDGNIQLTVTGILERCRANDGIWSALQFSENRRSGFPNISELTDLDVRKICDMGVYVEMMGATK